VAFIIIRLATFPEYEQTKDEDGLLPKQKTLKEKLSAKIISTVLNAYVVAAKALDEFKTFFECAILSLVAANKKSWIFP